MIGDPFSAQEALDMGLLNYVVPREKLMEKAMELAAKLAEEWAARRAKGQGGHHFARAVFPSPRPTRSRTRSRRR